ncbi:7016_t:CDS:2 [Gigaspora rosea]|nr:7016_t:CDS:2 [Gigaspora rosea]
MSFHQLNLLQLTSNKSLYDNINVFFEAERMRSALAIISGLIVKRTRSAVLFSIESSLLIASKILDIVKKRSTTRIDGIGKKFWEFKCRTDLIHQLYFILQYQ